ncbi:DUF2573 family protein [Peribacillus loiseleuriae]|uniref:DUF2573 domain-containing protein n=1 Tax=Peribacillus loiseleuriae TaxID=1679170 RepID=A0A0K9GYH9_9BACI|nr:DUF2573 family protein [Peribacillus loiseleuriae]KMY51723.1 hypothetical protein AC625_21140 [Peribacillus loiseleuriae]
MNDQFTEQFDGLIEKYTELLTGENDFELQEKVRYWALYSYIAKSMPALAKHWNATYPEAKQDMIKLIQEIKKLNDDYREQKEKA